MQHLGRFQPETFLGGAHAGLLVFLAAGVGGHRIADVVAAGLADDEAALLRQAVEPEGREERVQEARVVAILHVLHVELPVALQHLAVAAEHAHRRPHHAADALDDLRTEIGFERRRIGIERAEHQAAQHFDLELTRRILVRPRVGRHAALAAHALAEGDGGQVAGEVVAPVVIDADDVARLAALVDAQQRAAMRAAVLEGVELALVVARDHDRHRADRRRAVGVRLRQLGFEAEEIPGRPAEHARLLVVEQVTVRIDPVRAPARRLRRAIAARQPSSRHSALAHGSFTFADLITFCQRATSDVK